MKIIISLILLLFLTSFSKPLAEQIPESKQEDFSWLLGSWQRINEKEGRQTFERWTKQTKERLIGMGCTLKEGDTIWKENIVLKKVDNNWHFEVTGQGEEQPTVFTLTNISETSFVCENPKNEFPKVISYAKSERGLKAIISGGGPNITFDFIKIN